MKKMNQKRLAQIGWLSMSACALCCILPIVGVVAGIGAFATLAVYLEQIALGMLVVAALVFVWYYFQKKNERKSCANSCDVDCNCKPE